MVLDSEIPNRWQRVCRVDTNLLDDARFDLIPDIFCDLRLARGLVINVGLLFLRKQSQVWYLIWTTFQVGWLMPIDSTHVRWELRPGLLHVVHLDIVD